MTAERNIAKTVSERVRRGRAEETLSMILLDLEWMNGRLMLYASALTRDERGNLRQWFSSCLEKIPAEKDPLS